MDTLLGKTEIPMAYLQTEDVFTHPVIPIRHLQRLDSTIEDSPDDYRAGNLEDSDVGDSDVDEADDDAFAPRHNLTDEFVSGVPIPQASKSELADKFNHAEVKLVDEFSGRVNQDLVEQRRQEYMKLFLHADAIYSSPLTRALQTAVLTMNGHPATKTYGMTLMSTIREVKRIGGLDTVGVAYGEAIESRLRNELAMILGAEEADRLVTFPIDFNDANLPWWTPLADHESEQQQQDRSKKPQIDLATAILQRQSSPNALLVDDASTEDHAIVFMNGQKMLELGLASGDTVLLKGKKRRTTVATVTEDEAAQEGRIRMSKGVRSNLR
eukprot:gene1364-995_t